MDSIGKGRSALKTLAFSSRTSSASKRGGGSIAIIDSTCSMWFWNMSRSTPASS